LKPKALIIFGTEPTRKGSNEFWALEVARQLAEKGWGVVLAYLSPPTDNVREFLSAENVEFEVIPDTFKVSPHAIREFRRVLRKHSPRVVHFHYTGFLNPYSWMAYWAGAQRILFTDHGSRPEGFKAERAPWWKRQVMRLVNRPLETVICVSEFGYRCNVTRDLLPAGRYKTIHNSVPISFVDETLNCGEAFRRRYAIPSGRQIVLQVSWIIPEKGIPDLLRAAHRVIQENSQVQFVIAGEGAHRKEYTKLAETLNIAGHVTWTGRVEELFAEGVYAAADVVCQMSRWEEVFGAVIAEGMAYSKPMVATRVGGIPEVVREGSSGFLVDRGDTEAMADRILFLLRDTHERNRMGRVGRGIVESRFDMRKNVTQVVQLYLA
jgi:glycosyltransferase involved in cell wall biosynthesis